MGCANIAKRMVIPALLELDGLYSVKKIASRTEDKAIEFGRLFDIDYLVGYEELLMDKDINVIYMPLPTGLHKEWISKCFEYGKHVLVEKSLALNYEDCFELIEMAREKKLLLMENFMFCHHLQHKWIQDKLLNNEIGSIRLFRSQFGFPPLDKLNFRYRKVDGGGALLDAAAYTVKAAQMYLGPTLQVMSAALHIDSNSGVDIFGNASLINQKGDVAQLSFGFDNFYQCNYEIWGSTGRIIAHKAFTPRPNEQPTVSLQKQADTQEIFLEKDNHFINLLRFFYRSLTLNKFELFYDEILTQSRILDSINTISNKIII